VTATTRLFSLGVLVAVLATACGARAPDYDYSKEPNPRKSEFVIGPSDELQITVWRIGDVVANGKTPSQLKQEIQRRLAEFIKLDPSTTIAIAISNVNSYRFTVSGEVGQPGIHSSKVYVTVAEAIALAGGFTRFASRDDIVLMRRNQAGVIRRIPIVYSLIANGEYPEMNLVVMSGDSIFVP
jgi:polysaccharide export outer membrane protein